MLFLSSRPWLIRSFWAVISKFLLSKGKENKEKVMTERLAEIDGGCAGNDESVYKHIEQGLYKNPNWPAVICMFQPADYLKDWNLGREAVFGKQSNGPSLCDGLVNLTWLTLTHAQLHRTALALAAGLLAHGARPDTTVVMAIPNGVEYTILLYAFILLRITYVSLDQSLLDISGFTLLKIALRALKPQIIVAPDTVSGRAFDIAIAELHLPQPIRLSLSSGRTSKWTYIADIATAALKSSIGEDALIAAARQDNPERLHSIMFTSGTSGHPKGCPQRVSGMSHILQSQSWLMDAEASNFALQQAHNSRGIAPAQTLQTWKAGGAVVMTGQSFSVCQAAKAIRELGVTFVVLTPSMVHEMAAEMSAEPLNVNCVKKVQLGGDAVTKDILLKCSALFPQARVCVNHGMTEGGGSFVWPFFEQAPSTIPFFGEICPIGLVAPGSVIRIWDNERKCVVRRGELGELHISCASIINCYLGRKQQVIYYDERGRWFNTEDVAMVGRDSLVYILGRRKDMIKRAGTAIMPAAIASSIEAFTGSQV